MESKAKEMTVGLELTKVYSERGLAGSWMFINAGRGILFIETNCNRRDGFSRGWKRLGTGACGIILGLMWGFKRG